MSMMGLGVAAPAVTVSQTMLFGSYVMRPNNLGAAVQLSYNGSVVADNAFIPVNSNTQNGVIKFEGFVPNEPLNLTITFSPDPLTLSCNCPSPNFVVDNFQVDPANVITDGIGQAFVRFGARLTAQGGGYTQQNYSGTITVDVTVNN